MYERALSSQTRIKLWGFGLFYADAGLGGVFLKRYEFMPRLTEFGEIDEIWSADNVPKPRLPQNADERRRVRGLTLGAVHWIAHYEQWVRKRCRSVYRRDCVSRHPKCPFQMDNMAAGWLRLAGSIASAV
ncbi:MAG: hypothetical protein ACT4NX_02175 [Deltaproteobacteria bacterium]